MRFSIVIPTKNRPDKKRKIFASLMIQTKLPEQIIIIDQSSHDKIIKNELKSIFCCNSFLNSSLTCLLL